MTEEFGASNMIVRTPWIITAAALPLLAGCGLFSDDPEDDPLDVIIKEEIPLSFTIDHGALCPPTEDCEADPMPSPQGVDLPPFEIPISIDILELAQDERLADVASRLKRVEIEAIDYAIAPNTLNIPTPDIEMHLAGFTADSKDASSAFLITTLPGTPAETEASGTATVEQESQDQQSELFKELKFTAIAYGDKDIEPMEMFPPQGAAEYDLVLHLKFTANPVDALSQ